MSFFRPVSKTSDIFTLNYSSKSIFELDKCPWKIPILWSLYIVWAILIAVLILVSVENLNTTGVKLSFLVIFTLKCGVKGLLIDYKSDF